jgi:RND superfamily putative drug exporter
VARIVSTHTGTVLVGTLVLLVLLGLGTTTISEQQNELNGFRSPSQGTEGFSYIQASLPAGLLAPTSIVVHPASAEAAVWKAALAVPGVLDAHMPPEVGKNGYVQRFVVLQSDPYSQQAMNTVTALRNAVHAAAPPGATVLVGGVTAVTLDTLNASNRDLIVIAPAVLLVILIILCLLLRAVVAPVLLIATVVLSFFASLGVSVLVFTHVFGFQGIDPGLPILLFIFLVALGVDYNIFLMSRVREEAERYGTREGVMRGLTTTGSVITSAGVILAGTFSVLMTLPFKQLIDIGFAVAFGVLFDTVVVRSFLVPSLILTVGDLAWWPGRLAGGQVRPRPVAAARETFRRPGAVGKG